MSEPPSCASAPRPAVADSPRPSSSAISLLVSRDHLDDEGEPERRDDEHAGSEHEHEVEQLAAQIGPVASLPQTAWKAERTEAIIPLAAQISAASAMAPVADAGGPASSTAASTLSASSSGREATPTSQETTLSCVASGRTSSSTETSRATKGTSEKRTRYEIAAARWPPAICT